MVTVFQCHKCNSIIGDTDVPVVASADGIEVKHAVGIEIARGRVKCEVCKEVVGVEDNANKVFFNLKFVRRYVVQSVLADMAGGNRKKRRAEDEDTVSQQQFNELRDQMLSELLNIKETILALSERIDTK